MENAIGIITTNYTTSSPSELTAARPMAAVPIIGRYRMVDFMLSSMVTSGLRTIGLVLPHNYRSIVDHVSAGKEWSLDRKQGGLYMMPGNAFGSTRAGARFLIRDLLNNEVLLDKAKEKYVFLAAANIIINIDLRQVLKAHIQSGADITVVCQEAEEAESALMALKLDGDRVSSLAIGVQPGDMASLDCCVMSIERLKEILRLNEASDYLDLFEAIAPNLDQINVSAYRYEDLALPIFSKESYFKNSMKFLDVSYINRIFTEDHPILTKTHDIPPAKYEPGASVKNVLTAGGCRIAGTLENVILGRSVKIEPGAVVKNSIIQQSCIIREGAVLENVIIDKNNIIEPGCVLKGTPDNIFIKAKSPWQW